MQLSDTELEELLADRESDRVERKSSLSDSKKIQQAICAFANDLPGHGEPGVLFVGVDDGGEPVGLEVDDDLLLQAADLRDSGNILPIPALSVAKRRLRGAEVLVITVKPSDSPPVRFRGKVWVRVGPRRAIATPQEERMLSERRRAGDLPFDSRGLPSATLGDLDLDFFRDAYLPAAVDPHVLEANARTLEDQLRALRFLDSDGRPTALAILVCAREVERFLPGAYVQFVRFDGKELSSPIRNEKRLGGPVPELLRRLDEVLRDHLETAVDITSGPKEVRHPAYPVSALEQLARNAVLHRTYEGSHSPVRISWFDDRVEISNPGGPYGQVNAENFGQPHVTDYRNPGLAEAMKNLGFVQRFGVGIALARAELEKLGSPPPEFDVGSTFVHATVHRRPR